MPSSGSGSASSPVTSGSSSYVSLSAEAILALSGINTSILAQTDGELEAFIVDLRGYAEAEVSARVGRANFTSTTLEADLVKLMQQAVAYITARRFLVSPKIRRLTGTHEPLLMEESADFDEVIADLKTWSDELVATVSEVIGDGTGDLGDIETGSITIPFEERSPYSVYGEDLTYGV